MSFTFDWSSFNEENFYSRAKKLLTDALNKSNKPPIIVDTIDVEELFLGKQAPDLEILEIGDLADDRFRGIFKLNYSGDASITLATKVQANPLNVYETNSPQFAMPDFVGASSTLAMPLNLTLSEIKLSGIIILVYSKSNGLTLVFRNDPLESIKVTSTFDALPGIARFLQVQIENQIRTLFREELPTILHRLSHRWTPNGAIVQQRQQQQQQQEKPQQQQQTTIPESEMSSPKAKPVSLVEINPELPALSPTNMLRLDTLMASQRTLSLFTPTIPDVVSRSNLEAIEKRNKESSTSDNGLQCITDGQDYDKIMHIQSKNFARTSHKQPKRRVVRINKNKTKGVNPGSSTLQGQSNEKMVDNAKQQQQQQPSQASRPEHPVPQSQVVTEKKQEQPQPHPEAAQVATASSARLWSASKPTVPFKKSSTPFKGFFNANHRHMDIPPPYTLT